MAREFYDRGTFIGFPPAPVQPSQEDLIKSEPEPEPEPDANIVDLTIDADTGDSSSPIDPPSRNTTVHDADQDSLFEDPGYSVAAPAPHIRPGRPLLLPDVTPSHVPTTNSGIDSEVGATPQNTNNAARNPTEDEYSKSIDIGSLICVDLTACLAPIDTSKLDWGGSWPGSHKFLRRNIPQPDGEVYVAIPKAPNLNENGKRPARESAEFATPKQARAQDTTSAGSRGRQNPLSGQSGRESMSTLHNVAPSVKRSSRFQASCFTASPTPSEEVTYRC